MDKIKEIEKGSTKLLIPFKNINKVKLCGCGKKEPLDVNGHCTYCSCEQKYNKDGNCDCTYCDLPF